MGTRHKLNYEHEAKKNRTFLSMYHEIHISSTREKGKLRSANTLEHDYEESREGNINLAVANSSVTYIPSKAQQSFIPLKKTARPIFCTEAQYAACPAP